MGWVKLVARWIGPGWEQFWVMDERAKRAKVGRARVGAILVTDERA